ncbi:MAG: methyl-accepting chemotaxis protein [Gammaproteobacteria bacterium]|nr:methyl-accepting chemotaxis protein [Gammaproteobacteria bacterium]
MKRLINLTKNYKLSSKIYLAAGLFLSGMTIILVAGAYNITQKVNNIEVAIHSSSQQVNLANNVKIAILKMDLALQALIAKNEPQQIRASAVASIRAGAYLDEALANLPHDANSKKLLEQVDSIRSERLKIIRLGRQNRDTAALSTIFTIQPILTQIQNLSDASIHSAKKSLADKTHHSKKKLENTLKILAGLNLFGVALGMFIAFFSIRMMCEPLRKIEQTMHAIAKGDLTQNIDIDELGSDEIGMTLKSIRSTVETLRSTVADIRLASHSVNSDAEQMNGDAQQLSHISQQLNHGVEEINKNTHQVTLSSSAAADKISKANQRATSASELAHRSFALINQSVNDFQLFQTDMQSATARSEKLVDIANRISGITNTINSISSQTNLLALNAAIEAARAGEQGRGFAVVAEEVRTLASHTSSAVEEISSLIEDVKESVSQTVESMKNASEKADRNINQLKKVSVNIKTNKDNADQISTALADISQIMSSQLKTSTLTNGTVTTLVEYNTQNRRQSEKLFCLSNQLDSATKVLNNAVVQFNV